jgi:hypothetical protein
MKLTATQPSYKQLTEGALPAKRIPYFQPLTSLTLNRTRTNQHNCRVGKEIKT